MRATLWAKKFVIYVLNNTTLMVGLSTSVKNSEGLFMELICKRCGREFHGVIFHYILQGCLFRKPKEN